MLVTASRGRVCAGTDIPGTTGELFDTPVPWSQSVVIETFEALLIETLEPPLSRLAADLIEAGGDDGAWALRPELLKMEAEGGDRRMESCWNRTAAADEWLSAGGVKDALIVELKLGND